MSVPPKFQKHQAFFLWEMTFVEKTYDVLRSPLNLLTSMSSRFYGSVEDDNVLPQLENKS